MVIAPALALFLAAQASVAGQAAADPCRVVLRGANVWTGTTFERRDVGVDGSRFSAVPVESAPEVAASWMYLIPPFADAHTHSVDRPVGTFDARSRAMLASGIFYALNPNNMLRHSDALADRLERPGTVDAAFAGPGITGRGGHPRPLYEGLVRANVLVGTTLADLPGNAYHEAATPDEARAAVRRVLATGVPFIKLYLLWHGTEHDRGLGGEAFDAAAAEVRSAGRRLIVHVETAADFRRAVGAGAWAVMHLPGYLARPNHPREIYLLTDADAQAAASSDTFVVATVSPSMNYASGEPLSAMREVQSENLRRLRDAGVRIAIGGDQYGSDMLTELSLLNSFGLFTSSQLLAMATRNGTELIFPDRRVGRIDEGFESSFLAYPFDPRGQLLRLDDPLFAMKSGIAVSGGQGILPSSCAAANQAE